VCRADQGGALDRSHPRCTWTSLAAACLLVVALGLLAVIPQQAHAVALQGARDKARRLAADVGQLDARIGGAVREYAQATAALQAVRTQIRDNTRRQDLARGELALARATLAARAVALYKHADVSPLDAIFTASDFGDLVTGLNMVRSVTRSDHDVLRTVVQTSRQLAIRAESLVADKRTALRLVTQRQAQVSQIRARLSERRALLSGVRDQIRALAARQEAAPASSTQTVTPPDAAGGSVAGGQGQWWPLIQSAADAGGVSARGMYRLMMIESGGSAGVVGPGGYYGLFQYAPTTWKGSWNPYRSASIEDGSAQIKATAVALRLGYGHAWWDPSYSWAFQGK
jgi:peptidoglycan hydrolase CwlO-like protein